MFFTFPVFVYQSFVLDLEIVEGNWLEAKSPWSPNAIQPYSNVTWSYQDPVGATRLHLNLTSTSGNIDITIEEESWDEFVMTIHDPAKRKSESYLQ